METKRNKCLQMTMAAKTLSAFRAAGFLALALFPALSFGWFAPIEGDANATTIANSNRTVIAVTQSGKVFVNEPCEVELLIVGGGGGGGGVWANHTDKSMRGGGGGGGGVIHKASHSLTPGEYDIAIGAGGVANTNWNQTTAQGGDTTAFGFTAKGGGCGAMANNACGGSNGASGGGNSMNFSSQTGWAGKAIYTDDPHYNLGHDSGAAAGVYSGGGGGGGAGTAGNGIYGGDGYLCSITGAEVHYAGGGGGNLDASNGQGGGTASHGGGGRHSTPGGNGIVILSFANGYKEAFDDGMGGVKKMGSDANGLFCTHTFATNGTFTLPHAGLVEILLVGGGGGGGGVAAGQDGNTRSGGGGGGGVIHRQAFVLHAGEHPIVIGEGGIVNMGTAFDDCTGGATTAFGLTAHGGGYGAMSLRFTPAGTGGSGGGGSKDWNGNAFPGRDPSPAAIADGNLGNRGGDPVGVYGGGGGGGGAGAAASGKQGGDGHLCSISGTDVHYAGGGGGDGGCNGLGGGVNSYGGGGMGAGRWSCTAGGPGVVIVRYARKPPVTTVIVK
ncbi:MAG: glycine-rich domain-containing protein [Kiritimatiellia bacterium]|jgi:hypothetical protein